MTIEEFNKYIRKQPLQTYIVEIKLKYNHETEYRYTNEILIVENGCDYVWLQDWNEGEEDVEILNCVALNDIDLSLQWIPCDEKLPEEKDTGILKKLGINKRSDYVIVTIEINGDKVTDVACTYDGSWNWDKKYAFPDYKVTAWMPLPEPYKGCNYE